MVAKQGLVQEHWRVRVGTAEQARRGAHRRPCGGLLVVVSFAIARSLRHLYRLHRLRIGIADRYHPRVALSHIAEQRRVLAHAKCRSIRMQVRSSSPNMNRLCGSHTP